MPILTSAKKVLHEQKFKDLLSRKDSVGHGIRGPRVQYSETCYRSGTVNSNTVNSKFHLIQSST